jgi:hypothetical protein
VIERSRPTGHSAIGGSLDGAAFNLSGQALLWPVGLTKAVQASTPLRHNSEIVN